MIKKYLGFLFILFSSFYSFAQTGKISGNVLNEKNERLSGVSVKIVGAPGGVTTNVEGFYTLTLTVGQKYELEFSAVGYDKKSVNEVEIIAGQITHLDIVLAFILRFLHVRHPVFVLRLTSFLPRPLESMS